MSFDKENLLRKPTEQALANAGWEFEREAIIAPGRFRITGESKRESSQSSDYLLRFKGITLAVVETKYGSVDLNAAIEQANSFARRWGLQFAIGTDGARWAVRNLSSEHVRISEAPPSPEELICQADLPLNSDGWGLAISAKPFADKAHPSPLRLYQEQAIVATLSHFEKGNRRASLLMSPNVGLTFTVFQLI